MANDPTLKVGRGPGLERVARLEKRMREVEEQGVTVPEICDEQLSLVAE